MKNRLLFALLFLSTAAFSQQKMLWDAHGIGFAVPSNFRVETNNVDEFSASNDNLYLSILPFQDEEITKDNLADAVLSAAHEMNYDHVTEVDEVDLQDFTGYYVLGEIEGVHAVIMAMMDTESSTNMMVVIVYNEGYERSAVEMAKSFFAYD
ncbi:MAG: hypothetical protein IPL65_11725 [Lewinellaceae bacterium]|nr:hypothetical protein [Lewinellaceae bacterium]